MPDGRSPELPLSPIVAALPPSTPFVAPEVLERRHGRPIHLRLGANESAFGPSPRAVEVMREAARKVSWYGDPESHELREALAEKHGVGVGSVLVGNGIRGKVRIRTVRREPPYGFVRVSFPRILPDNRELAEVRH